MIASVLVVTIIVSLGMYLPPFRKPPSGTPAVITVAQPFIYSFNSSGILYEAGSAERSTSPYWWLNSGAKMTINENVGATNYGSLAATDPWRLMYALSNPRDTDNGFHPQNTFRLVSKAVVGNSRVESLFMIDEDNFSSSSYRNASNGLLLMNRYITQETLYYAGIRVDGTAVIKKKYNGTYYTMAQKPIFSGTYVREKNMNLLPHHEWIGLRTDTVTQPDGSVRITLSMKRENGPWEKILEARDNGSSYGATPPITQLGRAGIRTDFMDVQFESFKIMAL